MKNPDITEKAERPAAPATATFGPAGRGEAFNALGYKQMTQLPEYLAHFGFTAFEYQAGHGVRLNTHTAEALKSGAREYGFTNSIHAPYYITMSGEDEEKRMASIGYLLASANAVRRLGGRRVIFHCGGAGKSGRAEAMARMADTLAAARAALDDAGFEDILLCPETMGRQNQLGTLDEVLAFCRADARHTPCVDFGHLNARHGGSLKTKGDYQAVITAIGEALDDERARRFHVHFSQIEYTDAGERRHLTFADTTYGPPWRPFVEACAELGVAPTVICESRGTQDKDAQTMMKYYFKYKRRINIQ